MTRGPKLKWSTFAATKKEPPTERHGHCRIALDGIDGHPGELEVDLAGYRARFRDRKLDLSPSELEVLAIPVASRRICARAELSELLGLYGARTIDMILSKLRQRVDPWGG